MTTAAMVTYAYDQIDQARKELNAVSKQTTHIRDDATPARANGRRSCTKCGLVQAGLWSCHVGSRARTVVARRSARASRGLR